MEKSYLSSIRAVCPPLHGAILAGAVLLSLVSAPAQNLFVSVCNYNIPSTPAGVINQITPAGVQTTFATGLNLPVALTFDGAGNLFQADCYNGNIYKFTPGGARSLFATGLNQPVSLALNSADTLFEADYYTGNIYEFTPEGVQSTFASGLNYPIALAFDSAGNLFEADQGSSNIFEFTPGGVRSTFASGLNGLYGLAFNSAGDLFEADAGSGNIYEFTPAGVRSTFASGLNYPDALAFNGAGNLFVSDLSGNIYEYMPDGTRSTFASGFNVAQGLAFQPAPEPSVLWLLVVGATALLLRHRRNLAHPLATNLARSGVLPRVAMEFMRHSEMRLTNKTYTDVAHLPLAEAADMLPQFLKGKVTQKCTHETGAAGQKLASAGMNQIRAEDGKGIDNRGESPVLALAGTEGQAMELAHPSGVEPKLVPFLCVPVGGVSLPFIAPTYTRKQL